MLFSYLFCGLSVASFAFGLPRNDGITSELLERQDGACTNGPRTRNCWSNGYSINTDFDAKSPPDGTTVIVSVNLGATWKSPNLIIVQFRDIQRNQAYGGWEQRISTDDAGKRTISRTRSTSKMGRHNHRQRSKQPSAQWDRWVL
jgi:hypothetical protein